MNTEWKPIASAPKGQLVMVYTPPQPSDWPDTVRIGFDFIDSEIADDYWYNHGEHYEHYCCVAKPENCTGPQECAPYTHWMPLPAAPCTTCNGHGMIGGPSFYAPDEGGEPCPDCSPPAPTSHPIPTGATGEDERQAFEAWHKREFGSYVPEVTHHYNRWLGWEGRASVGAPAAGDALDAKRYRWLRDHACNSLHLTRDGDHACNYLTAAQWIESCPEDFQDDDAQEIERMKATNTIWRLQVYPNTPIGFWVLHASTLDAAIDASLAAIAQQKGEA